MVDSNKVQEMNKQTGEINPKTNLSITEKETSGEDHIDKYLSPNSFFNLTTIVLKNLQLNAPFPIKLGYEDLINYYPKGFMEGYTVKDKEGVFCENEEIVKRQSGVFSDMAKQVAKGLFKSGIVSISLPIRIFEPRSMLERYCDWWSFAPILLSKAGASKDKLQAFKYVICFAISAMFISTGQMKPFNPLLGETFEGNFEDGTKIYLEHTSHTPCISHFLITDPDNLYRFSGYCDIFVEGAMKMLFTNNMTMIQKGKNTVQLKNTGQTISYQLPKILLGGMIYGSRYVVLDGHMKFEDRENNLKAVIHFNKSHSNLKHRRVHDFYGQIFHHKFEKKKEPFYEEKIPKNCFPSDKKLIFSEISGSWLENIIFDNQIFWSVRDNPAPQIYPSHKTAPSDSRNREDLIWLKRSNIHPNLSKLYEDYAQSWKIALEIQQRHDRSFREKNKKK